MLCCARQGLGSRLKLWRFLSCSSSTWFSSSSWTRLLTCLLRTSGFCRAENCGDLQFQFFDRGASSYWTMAVSCPLWCNDRWWVRRCCSYFSPENPGHSFWSPFLTVSLAVFTRQSWRLLDEFHSGFGVPVVVQRQICSSFWCRGRPCDHAAWRSRSRNTWFDSGYVFCVSVGLVLGRIPRFST